MGRNWTEGAPRWRPMLALLLLCASRAPASSQAVAQDEALSEIGRAGDFQILQLWSDDDDRFAREWAQPTPPNLTTTTAAERNEPIYQFIIFSNCAADATGNCRLTARATVIAPDGGLYGEAFTFPVWDGEPAPPRDVLSLGAQGMAIVIEDGEDLGTYRIRLAVTDEIAGVTAVTEVAIRVHETDPPGA